MTRRREFLRGAVATGALGLLLAPAGAAGQASAPLAAPACGGPTPPQTAGPFFKPGSPRRASLLEPGIAGTRVVVTGRVLSTGCQPVAHARLDFWQADDRGQYDNAGYRLRGHQLTDAAGRYRLETIAPGLYPGRTRHLHVTVQAPTGPVLVSQLYFPGEPENRRDFIFDPALVLVLEDVGGERVARFDFVVKTG